MKTFLLIIVFALLGAIFVMPTNVDAAERPRAFSQGEWPNQRFGLEDGSGNVIIEPVFYSVDVSWRADVVRVRGSNGWGIMNFSGETLIPPVFINADVMSGITGYARVRSNTGWGTMSLYDGRVAVSLIYDELTYFSQGVAAVRVGQNWGYVTPDGSMHIAPSFRGAYNFYDGLAVVSLDGERWGAINGCGYIVIEPAFRFLDSFNNGIAIVSENSSFNSWWTWDETNNNFGIINIAGELIVPMEFSYNDVWFLRGVMSNPSFVMPENVEILHWRYIRPLLRERVPFRVTDVATGINWNMISLANSNHVDVEPVTAEDTAAFMRANGGGWHGPTHFNRPIWVTIGDRTFAATIIPWPHDISTIHDNNVDGHFCMYFYGSSGNRNLELNYNYNVFVAFEMFEILRGLFE